MAVKREHVEVLAGLVDTVVNAAVEVVDLAEEVVENMDKVVRKGAVALTNIVDVVDRLSEPVNGESSLTDNLLNLAKNNVGLSDAETPGWLKDLLDVSRDNDTNDTWAKTTDEVRCEGAGMKPRPVDNQPLPTRTYKINYIADRTTLTTDDLQIFEGHVLDGMYESIKRREAAPNQEQAWRNL